MKNALRNLFAVGLALLANAAFASDLVVEDAYARAASPNAKSGAAFMTIRNSGESDDRLLSVSSAIAARSELHTHIQDGDIMRMREVEDGFEIPAGGELSMERGGHHVMFMGLNEGLEPGTSVEITLTFERSGDMTVEIPVDLER